MYALVIDAFQFQVWRRCMLYKNWTYLITTYFRYTCCMSICLSHNLMLVTNWICVSCMRGYFFLLFKTLSKFENILNFLLTLLTLMSFSRLRKHSAITPQFQRDHRTFSPHLMFFFYNWWQKETGQLHCWWIFLAHVKYITSQKIYDKMENIYF